MHGDVERGGRLVGDDQARIAGKRHGDQHALAHAAGQLMRILRQQLARRAATAPPSSMAIARSRRAPRLPSPSRAKCSSNCAPMVQHRIERGHRRLRDEGDGAAEQRAPRAPAPCARGLRLRTAAIPHVIAKPAGSSCAMARPTMDLPAPDSPTRPRIFPGGRSNDSARIAGTMSPSMRAPTTRSLACSASMVSARFPQAARRACGAGRRPAD